MNTKLNQYCLIFLLIIYGCGQSNELKKVQSLKISTPQKTKKTIAVVIRHNFAGTYKFGANAENGRVGSLIVYPLTDQTALFFLDVSRGAPSYNQGQILGEMTIKDNIGIYDIKSEDDFLNCFLKFEFNNKEVKISTGEGRYDCGFGYAVYADNNYKQVDESVPKYFINGESDTIVFKGLTVEKYTNHL